jgi:hypothetical protein
MNTRSASIASIALLAFVGGTGCVASAEGLEPIGTSQEALLTGFGQWEVLWEPAPNTTTSFPLNWSQNNPVTGADTCWLSGVYGGLVNNPTGSAAGEAAVMLNNNQWDIVINPGTGTGLMVDVVCVNRNTSRQTFSWVDQSGGFPFPNPPSIHNSNSSNTQCYLQYIKSKSGLVGTYDGNTTGAWLSFVPGSGGTPAQWILNGMDAPQQDFAWGLNVGAICVDIPTTWTGTGSWGQGDGGGLIESTLVSNSGSTAACGMTGLLGDFADADVTVNNRDGAGTRFNGSWVVFADSADRAGHFHGGMGANYGCVGFQ